jgi:hypothetical protein
MLGVVAADWERFRWPGQALFLLSMSTLLLVACVQFGFRARQYLYSLGDVEQWRGATIDGEERAQWAARRETDLSRWRHGTQLARASYNLGIVSLGTGVALVVAPPLPGHHELLGEAWRWAAFWLVLSAAGIELIWSLLDWGDELTRRLQRWWLLRSATPMGPQGGDE